MLRYFFDTEFMDDGQALELISLGVVSEDGSRELYCINAEMNLGRASSWVQENVLPRLPKLSHSAWRSRADIRRTLMEFLLDVDSKQRDAIEMWSYYASYDWVVLCQLWGPMIHLPTNLPAHVMDVKQLAVMLDNPKLPLIDQGKAHSAIEDARWARTAWIALQDVRRGRYIENDPFAGKAGKAERA